MKKIALITASLLFLFNALFAAGTETLWTSRKIYVVLGVLLIILAGIIIFLIVLERKISKLEKTIEKH